MIAELLPEEASRHKCLIYEGHPSEQLPVILPLLKKGLQDNQRCLYLGPPEMVSLVRSGLSNKGISVEEELRRGALILSSDRSHLIEGVFDPARMIDMLVGAIDQALEDGFSGLCASGDMRWEFGADENFEKLLVYEAQLEQVFRDKPLTGICQYHRETVPARAVRDALTTHRSMYVGSELRTDNLYFMPPELLLEGTNLDVRDRQGEWMCDQITRVLAAEKKRDRALDALRKSEVEQRRLAEELAKANGDLDRRVRERTEELEAFVYSVSHDLRAPLRTMDGFSRMILEENASALDREGRRRLDTVVDASKRMRQLIDDLLRLSRTSRSELQSEAVDMQGLAREAMSELLAGRPRENLDVVIGVLPPCMGDRSLLRQVFLNLIGNALKYSSKRARAKVEVGASAGAGTSIYWVRDNGAGFDMNDASRLFGVFQRLHSESEYEGTGVGLALVKRIVERHHGRVWAEGVPDEGATFFFTLPTKD